MNTFSKSLMVASLLSITGLVAQAQDTSGAPAAQPTQTAPTEVKADRQELKKQNEVVKEDKVKLETDKKSGAPSDQIKTDKTQLKQARKTRHEMKKKLHADKANKMDQSVKQ